MVGGVPDAVQRGVAHDDVGRGHVDFGPQHVAAVGKFARAHTPEQSEAFLGRSFAPGAGRAGFGQGASVFAYLLGVQFVHIGLAVLDETLGKGVQSFKVVRSVVGFAQPLEAQPAHILFNGIHVLHVFLDRVGVVEAQVARSVEVAGQAEIDADGLGVSDVQIAVGLGGKAGMHPAAETAVADILGDAGPQKILPRRGRAGGRGVGIGRGGGGRFAHGVLTG